MKFLKRLGRFLVLLILLLLFGVGVAGYLMLAMPGRSHHGEFVPLSLAEESAGHRLAGHVNELALGIGPRNGGHPGNLERTTAYLAATLEAFALGVERHEFQVADERFENVIGEIQGRSLPNEIVVLGAHYDTFGDSPGADDNASGVAVVLEIARMLRSRPLARTVRFAFFAAEEPPFFGTEDMGSARYAQRCRERGENVVAMVSFESLGYFLDSEGSQQYPASSLSWFYPDTGNFVAFVGELGSRSLVRRAIGAFRERVDYASEGLVAPAFVPGVDWSDHRSFQAVGYPAVMVTDTAPYRNPNYHTELDIPLRIDLPSLARITLGLVGVAEELAGLSE